MSDEDISRILTEAESLSDIEIEEAEKLKRKLEKRHARNSRQRSRDRDLPTSVERTTSAKQLKQGIDPAQIRDLEKPDKINRQKLSAQRKKIREQQQEKVIQHVDEQLTHSAHEQMVDAGARRRSSKSISRRKSEGSNLLREEIVSDWQALKQKAEITEEEEVNFFVRESWPMDVERPKSSDKESIKYVRERAEKSVVGSVAVSAITQQPRASGDFASGLLDSQPHDLVWGRDRWPLPFERIEAESHILYSPSGLEVPLEVKTQGRSVRYAEDEGLYVGQLPFVAPANIRRLENRLLREAEYQSGGAEIQKPSSTAQAGVSQWFTEDGRMKMATSPLRDVLFRPLQSITFFNNVPEEFNYVFLPPLSDQEMRSLGQNYSRVHSRIQRPFQLPFRRPNDVGTTPVDFQQIEIELASVSFSFHPLFLAEHVFAHNLRMLVKALEDRVGRDYINACIQRIAALKRAIKQLEEKAAQKANREHVEDEAGLSAQIGRYQSEIDTLRRARNRAEGFERGLLTSILRCWKRIKDTREEQGFVSTTVGLKIIKENIDAAADDFAWKKEIAELTEEARKKHELGRRRLLAEYETALAGYQATLREETAGGKEKRNSVVDKPEPPAEFDAVSARKAIVSELATYRRKPGESKISVMLNEDVDITPEFECPRSEQERRKAVKSFTYFAKLFYNGKFIESTPQLCLDDKFTLRFGQVYPLQVCDPPDDISAVIYEKHACVIKRIAEVHLGKATLLSLNRCPSSSASHPSVSLSFGVLNPSPVCAGLCGGMSPQRVMAGVEFVLESLDGSGEALARLVPNGSVTLGVKWRLPEAYGNAVGDATCAMERSEKGGQPPGIGSEAQLDPNDPSYIKMLKTAKGPMSTDGRGNDDDFSAQTRAIGLSYFRLDPHLQEFCFCADEELDLSKRFRLLQLRNSGHRDFQEVVVPLNSREIPAGIFEELEPAKEETRKLKTTGLEQHFAERNRYLRDIGNEVLRRFEASIKKKTLDDVVAEEEIPSLMAMLPLLTEFLRPRRPLNPNRKEMKKTSMQNIKETGVVLVVTIGDAKNLPIRAAEQSSRMAGRPAEVLGSRESLKRQVNKLLVRATTGKPAEVPLRPVIEVRFEDFVQTTPVGEGCNPSWNSEFRIPYKPPPNLTNLNAVSSSILINVFDEVTNVVEDGSRLQAFRSGEVSTTETAAVVSKTVLHRSERRWLGGLEVPFSVVYSTGKITGNIEVRLPPAMLSYTRPRLLPYDETSITELSEEPPAFISVYLALQPAVKPFQALSDQVSSMESAELVVRVKSWEREVAKQTKEGRFDFEALVMDSSCRSVLACRFLVPQNPPPNFLPSSYTAVQVEEVKLRLARYVSLIPFFSDSVAFHGLTDVWCSSEQFLKMLCGDYEEHAVLLANYFLFLDAKLAEAAGDVEAKMDETIPNVLLCVGKAVPDGNMMFVLARNYTSGIKSRPIAQWQLWNPLTGRFYAITDVNSPLRTVSCLISPNKIWANVQAKEEPWEVNWDLTNHKCWLPLDAVAGESSVGAPTRIHLGRRHHKRSSSIFTVQPSKLSYSTPNEREILALKFELEGALKDSFIEWRRGEITRMNYEFMREMTKILEHLEDNFGRQNEAVEESLSRITQKYEAYGFPLNMYNMTKEEILERVKVTGLHQLQGLGRPSHIEGFSASSTSLAGPSRIQSNNVQFSVAVYIKPYPGNVLSIWIYLAALWPKAGGLLSLL